MHGQPVCSWSISMKYAMKYQFTVCSWSIHCKLGLEAGTEAENVYHVGQVVKCRIIIVFPASRRIMLVSSYLIIGEFCHACLFLFSCSIIKLLCLT